MTDQGAEHGTRPADDFVPRDHPNDPGRRFGVRIGTSRRRRRCRHDRHGAGVVIDPQRPVGEHLGPDEAQDVAAGDPANHLGVQQEHGRYGIDLEVAESHPPHQAIREFHALHGAGSIGDAEPARDRHVQTEISRAAIEHEPSTRVVAGTLEAGVEQDHTLDVLGGEPRGARRQSRIIGRDPAARSHWTAMVGGARGTHRRRVGESGAGLDGDEHGDRN